MKNRHEQKREITGTKIADHCSGFPDGDWGSHCESHDDDYKRGGFLWEKLKADFKLGWRVAWTPRNKVLNLMPQREIMWKIDRTMKRSDLTMDERDDLIQKRARISAEMDWAAAKHSFGNLKHRIGHIALAPLMTSGVILLHPFYKIYGFLTHQQVGFNWRLK